MKRIAVIGLLLILLCGCGEGGELSPTPELPSEVVPQSVEPSAEVSDEPSAPPHTVLDIHDAHTGMGDKFQIYVPYVDLDTEQVDLVNEYFSGRAGLILDAFEIGDVAHYLYEAKYNANGIVSYWFTARQEFSQNGIITEIESYSTDTVDYINGFRITLDDLFDVSRDEYMPRLFQAAFGGAYDQDTDYENYFEPENFCLTCDGVEIFFPPNTVEDVWVFVQADFTELADILAEWVVYE